MLIVGLSSAFRPAVCRNAFVFGARTRAPAFSATSPKSNFGTLRNIVQKRSSFFAPGLLSRAVTTDAHTVTTASSQEAWKRFGITVAAVAGTVILAEAFLNRDTRDALSSAERSYLHDSFKYTGAGLILTALTARGMFKSGATYRIMAANPWLVFGVSLAGSISTMMGVYYTPPENTVQKHLFWAAFNVCQGATLSPLFFFSPAILSRAALYTCGVVGALSYVGATARTDKYLYMGGPLLAGVTVVALSSLAPMALPLGLRGLAVAEALSIYGGLAVFGGFVLFDTQKILQHARAAQMGLITRDPMKEAISLELDMLNIFIRMVQVLGMRSDNKK
ncbi:Bax inhibitor family protein [Scleroderma citrinum]